MIPFMSDEGIQPEASVPPARPWLLLGAIGLLFVFVILSVRHAAISGRQMPSDVPLSLSVWQGFFIVVTLFLLTAIVIRVIRLPAFIAALFGAALFLGVWVYCWSLFPWEIALLIASGMTIIQARVRRVAIHDLFVLLGSAGVAIHFAFIFTDRSLIMIFAAFFIYDMVAGRPNGPVVKMASALVHRGVIPGLILPSGLKRLMTPVATAIREPDSVFLGAGDLILPTTLVARAAAFGWWQALAVGMGGLIGFSFVAWRKSLRPFPAFVPVGLAVCIPYFMIILFA
jgi:presenilin-like A22 family membrane protease